MDVAPGFVPSPWIIDDLTNCGWSTIPAFLPAASIRALAAEAAASWTDGTFHPAGVGRGVAEQRRAETRSDHVLWLDEGTTSVAQLDYFGHMECMRLQIEAQLYLGSASVEAHMALFETGSFYRRHTDALAGASTRVLSTVLYLNDDWLATDGGALRLYLPGAEGETTHDIYPLGGTLALFLSDDLEHEVLPATRDRLSITGWMLRR